MQICVLRIAEGVKQCRLIVAEISHPKLVQEEVEEVEQKLTEAEHSRSQLRRFCTKVLHACILGGLCADVSGRCVLRLIHAAKCGLSCSCPHVHVNSKFNSCADYCCFDTCSARSRNTFRYSAHAASHR